MKSQFWRGFSFSQGEICIRSLEGNWKNTKFHQVNLEVLVDICHHSPSNKASRLGADLSWVTWTESDQDPTNLKGLDGNGVCNDDLHRYFPKVTTQVSLGIDQKKWALVFGSPVCWPSVISVTCFLNSPLPSLPGRCCLRGAVGWGPAGDRSLYDVRCEKKLGGGFHYFWFSTLFGEDSHFDYIIFFQVGWNHQLENLLFSIESWLFYGDPYDGSWNNPHITG